MIPVRVVKVGGSLFNWEQTPVALSAWLAEQQPTHNVLIAGGGHFADLVRAADRRFLLGEVKSHWICVDLLRATARLLATLLPEASLIGTWSELTRQLDAAVSPGSIVFDSSDFLYQVEPAMPGEPLKQSWEVTSDTIAARVAQGLGATELVLLKSISPIHTRDLQSLADSGIVDRGFPRLSASLPRVRIVNLRCRAN